MATRKKTDDLTEITKLLAASMQALLKNGNIQAGDRFTLENGQSFCVADILDKADKALGDE